MSLETKAAKFIKQFEGYSDNAYWDVNAYRLGYGSDTIELSNGTHRRVQPNDVTTRAMAEKDLARRVSTDFIPAAISKVGIEYWNKLPDNTKIALADIAYNYGTITKQAIIEAARSGNLSTLADAIISSTYNDNGGQPEGVRNKLRERRAEEAMMVRKDALGGSLTSGGMLARGLTMPKKDLMIKIAIGTGIAATAIILSVILYKRFKK